MVAQCVVFHMWTEVFKGFLSEIFSAGEWMDIVPSLLCGACSAVHKLFDKALWRADIKLPTPRDPICPLSDSAKHLLALDSDAMSWLLGVLFCWQDRRERKVIGCLRAATENGPCASRA